ncbi:MAG TPA: FISUMP domain-containing protein [Ignavibacteriaceae bacterium]|nr:FISUMP domain-containing protein [Ignavibacteriaceae bacterium]
MKKIFYLTVILSMMSILSAQHKTLTLYYPNDSTNVVSISDLDSMSIFICGASKVNYGGKDYNTVLIGNQCWLKENLDVGTMINSTIHSTNDSIIEKYCYGNNPANCDTYGGLYQWNEAMQYVQTEGAQGICPEGWHIPTEVEFNDLYSVVGGNGNAIKAIGQGSGSGAGTNTSGFSALLAGNKETSSSFMHLLMRGHFWSSSLRVSDSYVYRIYLWDDRPDFSPFRSPVATYGFSVRCIKN